MKRDTSKKDKSNETKEFSNKKRKVKLKPVSKPKHRNYDD